MEAGRVLEPRGPCPVEREGQRRPGGHRSELLLPHVVVEPAAVLADAAAEDEAGDGGAVGVIAVVPLVHAGADDDRALAAGLVGGGGPFPGEADHLGRGDAGEALLPGGGIGGVGVVVGRRVVAGETTGDPVLGEEQVVDGRHLHRTAQRLHGAHRDAAKGHLPRGILVEGHLGDGVGRSQEGGLGVDLQAVDAVLHLEVPLPFLVLPAEAQRAAGHAGGPGRSVPDQELEIPVLGVLGAGELAGAQHAAGAQRPGVLLQLHQERGVAVAAHVVEEVGGLLLVVELLQDDVVHRQPEGGVLAGVDGDPLIGVLGRHAEVGAEHHQLGAVVAGLGREVDVGGAGHSEVRAHRDDELGVIPVGALGHVGLLSPDLGRGIGQVAVPVVEGEVDAAEELEEAGAGGEAQHRHGRDGAEADDPVGAVLLHGVDGGGSGELQDLLPGAAAQPALAAGLLVALALHRVVHDRRPGGHRIGVDLAGLPPEVHEHAAQVGVLHPQRTVEVPGGGDAPLASTRLVGGHVCRDAGVVGGLGLERDHAVLHVDVPGAAARAVHAVRAPNHLVVLEAVPVDLLPAPLVGVEDVLHPAHREPPACEG